MKCKACDGKGNDGYHKTEPCEICGGTGSVTIVEDEPIVEEEIPKEEREDKKPKRRGR